MVVDFKPDLQVAKVAEGLYLGFIFCGILIC